MTGVTHTLPILMTEPPPPAPGTVRHDLRLIDSHGRTIRDLRLSVTDRCNFRCVYCMEPDVRFKRKMDLLTLPEMVRLASLCVEMGVRKIRITGGEPTVYPHLDELIAALADLPIEDLAMTTNGSLLTSEQARAWRRLGLRRLTFSIDTLRDERFTAITRSTSNPTRVLDAVRIARDEGLTPVRLNAVIMRGFNDDEIADLAGLARDLGVEVRFIEYMPLDSARAWDRSRLVPAREIVDAIRRRFELVPLGRESPNATATRYAFADGAPGAIGIIASVTQVFCDHCSRLRITADGQLRTCLFSTREFDLRGPMRRGITDDDLRLLLLDATWTKPRGHEINSPDYEQPARPMSSIGG